MGKEAARSDWARVNFVGEFIKQDVGNGMKKERLPGAQLLWWRKQSVLEEDKMVDSLSCKTCGNYELMKMITSGPYGYTGDIPCLRCCRFQQLNDEHTALNNTETWIDKRGLTTG